MTREEQRERRIALCGKICKECKYYDMRPETKHSIGYPCYRPNHKWRSNVAMYRVPSTPACVGFVERGE